MHIIFTKNIKVSTYYYFLFFHLTQRRHYFLSEGCEKDRSQNGKRCDVRFGEENQRSGVPSFTRRTSRTPDSGHCRRSPTGRVILQLSPLVVSALNFGHCCDLDVENFIDLSEWLEGRVETLSCFYQN